MKRVPLVSLGKGPPNAWWTLLGSEQIDQLVSLALRTINRSPVPGAPGRGA